MDNINAIVANALQHSALEGHLSLSLIFKFLTLVSHSRNDIILAQHAKHHPDTPPNFLPPVFTNLCSRALNVDGNTVNACWDVLKHIAWNTDYMRELKQDPEIMYQSYGVTEGLTARVYYPPSLFCTHCDFKRERPLKQPQQQAVVVFTVADGTLPAYHVHLYCNRCKINYHHNFYVKAGQRYYYEGIPDTLQVGEHQFVERRLVEQWIALMGTSCHAEIWKRHKERGQSRFKLQKTLQRARMANAEHPAPLVNGPEGLSEELEELEAAEVEFEVDSDGRVVPEDLSPEACPDKPTEGNRRIWAQLGRKRTHNEQIIVAPCGVIIARVTFYGAEAPYTVVEFIRNTFEHGKHKPEHIFFDNNCTIFKITRGDPWWEDIMLTVDVFHHTSKHSKNDLTCQQNCNPIAYPELLKPNGDWYFNSSIAEQTNVWLAGYNAICREMKVDRFNFFLDELIMRRNEDTIADLRSGGQVPGSWHGLL
ncbi:hypothetical protein PsYK624_013470 [Phanerochaete sordida]|uniref:CxC5 like cysteine cluster associated with KDZ domain-containing protein n=1 Tax=Phanerochaete sordida TaxID=48140 RepID=A0A9P3FZ59_9APHY|nr:hypothetical protein PsYK624_013470 [Phanerochaete sordida]